MQNYFAWEGEAVIPFLKIDTGHAKEVDLDGDGTIEIVATHGTPMASSIYKRENNEFFSSSVNEALDVESAWLLADNRFEVQEKVGAAAEWYRYRSGEWIAV